LNGYSENILGKGSKLIKDIFVNIVKASLKYFFIFLLLFVVVFFTIFMFNFFPFVKIGLKNLLIKDILNLLLFPTFCIGFYTALVFSFFIYSILVINYQKKLRIIYYIIPLIIGGGFVFLLTFFLKPKTEDVSFKNIDDARVYFTEKTFFDYKDKIPEKIEKVTFENIIVSKIENPDEKNFVSKKFTYNMKDDFYYLNKNISNNDKNRLLTNFYKINYLNKVRFYFTKINKESIEDVILIQDQNVYSFDKLKVKFIKDKIFINIDKTDNSFEFDKLQLNEYEIYKNVLIKKFIDILTNFQYKFFIMNNILHIVLLIISMGFLVLAFSTIIIIGDYPFLSLVFKIILLIAFYFGFDLLFNVYFRTIISLLPQYLASYNELIFSSILVIIGLFIHGIRILFFKTNIWEKD